MTQIWAEKPSSGENIFLLKTLILAEIRDFKFVVGWFSPVFSGLTEQKQINRQTNSIGGALNF